MRRAWRRIARALAPIAAFLVGVITSLCVVALHQSWWWLGLAVIGTGAALLAPPDGGWLRIPFALGWDLVVVAAVLGKPEGDFVLSSDAGGYAVLVGGLAVLVGAVVTSMTRGEVNQEV